MNIPVTGINLTDLYGSNAILKKDICDRHPELVKNQFLYQSFRTAGKLFKVIDEDTVSVLVPFDKGRELIHKVDSGKMEPSDFKRITSYSISMFQYKFKEFLAKNFIQRSDKYGIYILNEGGYDKDTGIKIKGESVEDYIL